MSLTSSWPFAFAGEGPIITGVMDDHLESPKCARLLKALADPDRLKLIQCLQAGRRNVSELADLLARDVATVSHHLGVLRNARLVVDEKQGRFTFYSLDPTVYRPPTNTQPAAALDFGCCRIELTGR